MFGALKRGFRRIASLILVRNVVGELQPKRTLAASRGFLAATRLSCLFIGSLLIQPWSGSSFWMIGRTPLGVWQVDGTGSSSSSKVLSRALRPMGWCWSLLHSPQPDTSRSRKTTDTGAVQCYARLPPSFRWYSLTDNHYTQLKIMKICRML